MKRIIAAIIFLSIFSTGASGQNLRLSGKKAYKAKISTLLNRVDSLQMIIDSLRSREMDILTDSEGGEDTGDGTQMPLRTYTTEETDSLLALWYENNFSQMPEADIHLELDSVNITSNVPDSIMMERLEALNVPFSIPFNETVRKYMILYSEKMPEALSRLLGLSNYYFPIFEEALLRYNLPLELKYMTIVESRLQPTALSPAGAMGLWQFMYRVGKHYGLRIDSYVDERLDAEKSADAAARYLKDAYEIFGDWSLAISSYNCGSGNVKKAIQRAGGRRDYWSVHDYLPRETRRYVPAIIGAMYAMSYARDYGIQAAEVGFPAIVDTLQIHRNLHFKQINEVTGIPLKDLQNLNPCYYQGIIPGDGGPCTLKLPYSMTTSFLAADQDSLYLHKAGVYLSEKVLKEAQTHSSAATYGNGERIRYKVRNGDCLGKIASRYHVSVKSLKKWNNLRSDMLRIGQTLYIYK